MMIPSTSNDSAQINPKIEAILDPISDYEDAVSSEEELHKLCDNLKNHLIQTSRQRKERKAEKKMRNSLKSINYQRSSSSDHSSIEKLQPNEMRSRRNTGHSRRRTDQNATSPKDSDSDQSDWRLLNFAFQEMAHYPLLVQLNEQLTEISRQLNDVETTNGLQLKIIMHLLHRISKPRSSWFQTIFRFLKSFQFFIFAFSWPFITRILYNYYLRYIQS